MRLHFCSQMVYEDCMSRSFRTQKRSRLADRRVGRDRRGNVHLPRIIERRPRHGDVHPADRQMVRGFLQRLPIEYIYGLKRIELRPRPGAIGQPYGLYRPWEKTIILYSLPMAWELPTIDSTAGEFSVEEMNMEYMFSADIRERDGTRFVHWPAIELLAMWFCTTVLAHELGHHHRNQYRFQHRPSVGLEEEIMAEIHALRIWRRQFLPRLLRRQSAK